MISIKCRDEAYAAFPVFGKTKPASDRRTLLGDVLTEGEIWACTTCGACEDACPVLIEYVDKIVDLRRHLVEEGRVPPTLQKALADTEKKGNPYGKMPRKRGDWVRDADGGECGVRILKRGEEAEDLFFTDSCAAYDPRIQQIARTFGAAPGRRRPRRAAPSARTRSTPATRPAAWARRGSSRSCVTRT